MIQTQESNTMNVGIIGAMEPEVKILREAMQNPQNLIPLVKYKCLLLKNMLNFTNRINNNI